MFVKFWKNIIKEINVNVSFSTNINTFNVYGYVIDFLLICVFYI